MDEPKIITIDDRKLVGLKIQTSLIENKTFELWKSFKQRIKELTYKRSSGFYSMHKYNTEFTKGIFTPETKFEKWAAVEVDNFDNVPAGLERYLLSGGKYAVFKHKGPASSFHKTAQHIFGFWIPNSAFELDDRIHFEMLTDNYLPEDPNAEEEVWIPIK